MRGFRWPNDDPATQLLLVTGEDAALRVCRRADLDGFSTILSSRDFFEPLKVDAPAWKNRSYEFDRRW
jgi:hypothetical protein